MERAVAAMLLLLLLVAGLEGYRIAYGQPPSARRPARRKAGEQDPAAAARGVSDFHRTLAAAPFCVHYNFVAARADGCALFA